MKPRKSFTGSSSSDTVLTQTQLEDLASLHLFVASFNAEFVIIGAAALGCFIDIERFTMDVDLAVALDTDDFAVFAQQLQTAGWTRDPLKEHRWYGPAGSTADLLPAGPGLRKARRLVWPVSGFEVSLVGIEHVFTQARQFLFAEGVQYRVASLPVLALLKIIAFMDDPYGRAKDRLDLQTLFRAYERDSDRIFAEDVLEAGLDDVECAGAYLLGRDLSSLVNGEELEVIHEFLEREWISDGDLTGMSREDDWLAIRFQQHLRAFRKGLLPGPPA